MEALQWLSGLSPVVQILVIVAALVYRKEIATWLKKDDGEGSTLLPQLLSQMQLLTQHFNHETTEAQEKIVEKLDHLKDTQEKTNTILQEFKEYGIKVRGHAVE